MAALNSSLVWPTPLDSHQTQTSEDQIETEESIDELFKIYRRNPSNPSPPIPTLTRSSHLSFVSKVLQPLPAGYITMDSNRAWLIYWVLHSHDLLSISLDVKMKARAIRTLLSFQNIQTGGFGGGPGQISHLMSTYAAVSALAIVGGKGKSPSKEEAQVGGGESLSGGGWDEIDR
jgi:protein farnesyltransferase subunit beta